MSLFRGPGRPALAADRNVRGWRAATESPPLASAYSGTDSLRAATGVGVPTVGDPTGETLAVGAGPEVERVAAIVVCHNGRPFIRDTLRALSRQTRPIDELIVVDTGSRDGTAEWVRAHLGTEAVVAVRGQFGRAVTIAMRHPRMTSATWLWLLHDDSAPAPDALAHLLAEAAYTPAAAVLGPKLVGWDDPNQLQEVGWWIDRAAFASSPVEDREIDQGQHDHLSEVFYVSTAGMLVRREAMQAAGGFDTRMPAFRDDLDLCWRVHLTGGKVLVVPQARVRHFRAAAVGSRISRTLTHRRYLTERHALAALLKATAFRRLVPAIGAAFLASMIRILGLLGTGRIGEAGQVLFAWGWNVKELPVTFRLRRRLQAKRTVTDRSLTRLRAPGGQRVRSVVRALSELVTTDHGGTHASTTGIAHLFRRLVTRHPVVTVVAAFAAVMAISLRGVLLAGQVSGDGLAAFPASARELFGGFAASLGTEGIGSSLPASPSLVLYGIAALLAFGKGLLAQKILLWLALPLAAATCTRALRLVVPDLRARAIAGVLYATTPLATAALSQGRVGELAFLVLAPPILAQVWLALQLDQPREPWRPALRFAVLLAVAVAFYPPALVIGAAVAVLAGAVAVVLAPVRVWPAVLGRFGLLALGLVAACVLLLPWSLVLFTGASPLLGHSVPAFSPSFVELIQLLPGGEGQLTLVGPLYPALALTGVVLAAGARRMLAFWLGLGLLVSALVAAWEATGSGMGLTDWPGGLLIPGTVLWAAMAGIGFGAVLPALSRARHGFQRAGAVFVAVLTTLAGLLVVGNLARGDWALRTAPERLPANVTQGQARVLWLAGRPGGGVRWTVTGPEGRTLLDTQRPSPTSAQQALGDVVADIVHARTHRAGAMLRMFNVGFVVVRDGPEAGHLTDLLARQGDLESRVTEQAALFEGLPAAPAGVTIAGAPPSRPEQLLTLPVTPTTLAGSVPAATGTVRGPSTVLLPMPADNGWRASVGGTQLERASAFGWSQAFRVPAGVAGPIQVSYSAQRTRTFALIGELVLALVAFAMLARPTRRPPPPAPVSDEATGELRLPAALIGRSR